MAVLPRVGERFGRYRIDSQIGRGGMGVVYGATDLSFDRTVALKVVSAALGDSADFQQRFQREASVLARLDSPHVISIFDYGVEDDCPYIATQYVGGGDLGGLIRTRGAMPPVLALTICAQVADALHDAHRVGVVHRDVKPANVLLRDADANDAHAYLCDFGIARTASDGLTAPGSVAGTWSYLSPECGRGAPGTPSSDIYALGCLLWVALTGSAPYTGSDLEVAVAHQEAPVPQVEAVDEPTRRLNEVLARSMAKRPEDRFADADQMRTALLAVASAAPASITSVATHRPAAVSAASPARPGDPTHTPTTGRGATGTGTGSRSRSRVPFSPQPDLAGGRRRRTTLVVAAAVAVVLVVAGGAFGVSRLTGGDSPTPVADPSGTGTDGGTGPDGGTDGSLVTGDRDGDGLGDFRLVYHYYQRDAASPGGQREEYQTVLWTSDGTKLTQQAPETDDGSLGQGREIFANLFGDFDGDGVAEPLQITTTVEPSGDYRLVGTLSGAAAVDTTFTVPDKVTPVPKVADVDGDGDDDLLFRYVRGLKSTPSPILMSISDGAGGFTAIKQVASYPYNYNDATFVVGDFDGDGKADLAQVVDLGSNADFQERFEVTFLLGTGDGFTTGPVKTIISPSNNPTKLAADLDGDGDKELVLVSHLTQVPINSIDLVDGQIVGPTQVGSVPGAQPDTPDIRTAERVTDVNGDGRDDIALISEVNNHHAAIRVAVSDGTRLTASKWAVWDRDFKTKPAVGYFDTGSDSL